MAYALTAVTGVPEEVTEELRERLNRTFGCNPLERPSGTSPIFTSQSITDIAKAAMEAMATQQAVAATSMGATFQEEAMLAMRTLKDNAPKQTTKQFTDIQK